VLITSRFGNAFPTNEGTYTIQTEAIMFNRVKTIGLLGVGLLAMLATKAEAHYMYARGNYYYHSVGCEATIGSVPVPSDRLEVKCRLVTVTEDPITGEVLPPVEVLCQDQSIVTLPDPVSLVVQVITDPGETHVEVIISNSPFKYLCGGNDPTAVLIHNFSSTITISKCTGSLLDPCSLLLETSIATTPRCMLPTEGNYDIHNLPPGGTQYDCEAPLIVHVN